MNKAITSDILIDAFSNWWDDRLSLDEINTVIADYLKNTEEYRKKETAKVYNDLLGIIFSKETIKDYYYVMSALFRITMIPEVYYEIIRYCIEDTSISKEIRNFIFCQCNNYRFLFSEIDTLQSMDFLDELYSLVLSEYKEDLLYSYNRVPTSERNPDLIFVITPQILSINHAPTRFLMERCYVIETVLNKKVFIINTADALTYYGITNWYDTIVGDYYPDLDKDGFISYKDKSFALFQCPREMPQTDIISEILNIVYTEKPYAIVSMGGNNITSDLCSSIIPAISIPLGHNNLSYTTFQAIDEKSRDHIETWSKKHGFDDSHYIITHPTYDLTQRKTAKLDREALGLPKNSIICLTVGYRLDFEIDEHFIKVVETLAENNIYSVYVGSFDYKEKFGHSELLQKYTIYLGLQKDTLAICECCDIYLNPRRSGGGTSAAEALFKGLPVITQNYGDVAIAVGRDFVVEDYSEMLDRALKLATNKQFYEEQSKKAKERAAILTDTAEEFVRIIREMESRSNFI